MDAQDFWLKVGSEHAAKVCELAGVDAEYFRHVRKCRRRPSVDYAKRLEHASIELEHLLPRNKRAIMSAASMLRTNDELAARRAELERKP